MDNAAVARALREIAALLALEDDGAFKARAYERGARAVEALSEDVAELARSNRLRSVPGIGASLARTIVELRETGQSEVLARLRASLPPGAPELAGVLTRPQMERLHAALGIETLADLRAACEAGRVRGVHGFGERSERRLLEAIAEQKGPKGGTLLADAADVGERLLAHLRRHPAVERADVAGDVRRRVELVPVLDLVVATRDLATTLDHAAGAAMVGSVLERGDGEIALRLVSGPDARIRAVAPEAYPLALFRATGSDAHVAKLATVARSRGLGLEADGLFEGARRVSVASEGDVYRRLGLPEIPPEMREDRGEVEAARAGSLPQDLVRLEDLRGLVHCHTVYSDGRHTVEEMARAAEARGMAYMTITDHSPTAAYARGLDVSRLRRQWDEIARVQERVTVRLLRGTECDILRDGALDYPDSILAELDVVIASVHNRYRMSREDMTRRLVQALRHPCFKIWGHPLGRYVGSRPPIECDMGMVLGALAESRAAIEVNGDPHRLDLPPEWIKEARGRGIRFVISTDAHSTGALDNARWGVAMARRGWLTRGEILNALDVDGFRAAVKP